MNGINNKMMMHADDFEDTGFWKGDFDMRVDVLLKRHDNKEVKII